MHEEETHVSDALIAAAADGDGAAWAELVALITPRIRGFAAAHPAMRKRGLATRPDDVAEVATACIERLARAGKRNLKRYLERKPAQSFDSWLYGAVDYAIRDHLRARYGRAPALDADDGRARPSKRELHSAADALDPERQKLAAERLLGVTTHLTVLEIFAYVEAEFDAEEVRALRLHYVEDRSLSELAIALGLPDEAAAERLLRRLKARLRKRFGGT